MSAPACSGKNYSCSCELDTYSSRGIRAARSPQEFGTDLPDDVTVRVHDSNADMRYMVVPLRPPGTERWSEQQVADLLTRDTLAGVTVPRPAS